MERDGYRHESTEYTIAAQRLDEIFIQRRDIVALQMDDGRYVKKDMPLTDDLLVDHLRGELTLGVYLLDQNSQARYLGLDADHEPGWRQLQALALVLEEMGSIGYLERSRRGGHLWLFTNSSMEGKRIRTFGQGLLDYFNITEIELFPKQDRLKGGPGSLVRLPFGIHRKSGKRYSFYTPQGEPLATRLRDQIEILSQAATIPEDIFQRFHAIGKEARMKSKAKPAPIHVKTTGLPDDEIQLSGRIKAAIPIRQFIHSYVPLSKNGMGRCPFHDDQVESFSVNDEGNYWHCFGCDQGGSIIDLYMLLHACDFTTAVRDLAKQLL